MNHDMTFTLKYAFMNRDEVRPGSIHHGAYQGVGVARHEFNRWLSNPISVFLFQGAPVVNLSRRLSLNYEWNLGMAFGWNAFDEETNPENKVIGSKITAYLDVDFYIRWMLSRHLDFNAGVSLSHFSNGNTAYPNMGLNTGGIRLGLAYYVNRASYLCLYIIMPVMGLLMGWLAEENRISEGAVHRTLFAWITTVLIMMTIAFPVRLVIQQRAYRPQRNMEKVEQLAQKVKDVVPPDTIGFGEGVDEIYSYLGWNANYFGMDLPDIIYSNEVCVDYIFELIETADCIFVNDDSLNTLSYYFRDNTWKEEVFMKEYTCIADIYYDEGSKYNYRLYKKLK